jgi:hypothetical protein
LLLLLRRGEWMRIKPVPADVMRRRAFPHRVLLFGFVASP